VPALVQRPVAGQLRGDLGISRSRVRQLSYKLGGYGLWPAIDVDVIVVDVSQDQSRLVESDAVREGRDVEVVTGLVAAQGQPGLEPQDLRRGRYEELLA